MKRWILGITLLVASALLLAACGDDDSETPRPTEIRVVTSEPEVANLQSTISALETRQAETEAENADGTEEAPDATSTNTPAAIAQGVVIGGDAIVFADADDGATELGRLPANTGVEIVGEAEPNRIGVVFYQIRHDDLTGWVASTQIQVQEAPPETPDATQADTVTSVPVTPTITNTPRPTATFPPSPTPTITPTPLPIGFPTPERYSVVVVEQVFERGFMIWIEPIRQIWVLTGDDIDPAEGTWECYEDDFAEGMPERDPALEPPEGTTTASQFEGGTPMQPIRGFGKVWRDNFDVREALGWALNPELKHSTVYEYFAGGEMDDDEYDPGPGEYRVESLFQYTLVLYEDVRRAPCEDLSGTWEIR